MFDFSFAEMAVIAVVGLMILGPKELPVIAKKIRGWLRSLKAASQSMRDQINDVLDEDDRDFIIGDDGKRYRTFGLDDFLEKPSDVPSYPKQAPVDDGQP